MAIDFLKEIIFASDNAVDSRMISYKEKKGILRKIAPRIYTTNTIDSPESIVKRNLIEIVAWRLPGCVLSHKSAYLLRPTEFGNLFITYRFTKKITDLPGITLNVMEGPEHIDTDIRLGAADVYASSEERWMLEMMQQARTGKDGDIKKLPDEDIEKRLEEMIKVGGEERLNRFRDNARNVSELLGMVEEFKKLNKIISALLTTHDSSVLSTAQGLSRAAGMPMDGSRIVLFDALYDQLSSMYFSELPDHNKSEEAFRMFSFFESYFSNYIEGTEFEINEAKQIVDTGITLPKRTADSHDILGTFKVLSNRQEMSRTPATEDEFLALLRHRHSVLLSGRPDCSPGEFKTKRNRAGNTEFVDPSLVEGTLRYGFKQYKNLRDPFARAVFMMFLCSEVHPFTDGNGRVSRIMMNAELVATGQTRIIVPTVFREDYILALRGLSRRQDPKPFISVLQKLQTFSSNLWGENFYELDAYLKECNAYEEPDVAKLKVIDRIGTKS